MAFTLPALTYPLNALEPHIDARTMEIHHAKHHQAYINNVNNALKGKVELESKTPIKFSITGDVQPGMNRPNIATTDVPFRVQLELVFKDQKTKSK